MIKQDALVSGLVGLSAAWIVSTAILFLALDKANQRAVRAEQTIEHMTEHTGRKSGVTSLLTGTNINYDLRTFNSGKTWYAVERDSDWGLSIIGEAEEIYPGLLDHIKAMDRLTQHVQENGPIGIDDIQLLEDAGFEVKRK